MTQVTHHLQQDGGPDESVVRTNRIELVDELGRERIVLSVRDSGPAIWRRWRRWPPPAST